MLLTYHTPLSQRHGGDGGGCADGPGAGGASPDEEDDNHGY